MELISVRIPEPYLDILSGFVRSKYYPSIAEAIRTAIRDFIKSEHFRMKEEDARILKNKLGIL